jgi:hypothetical protein
MNWCRIRSSKPGIQKIRNLAGAAPSQPPAMAIACASRVGSPNLFPVRPADVSTRSRRLAPAFVIPDRHYEASDVLALPNLKYEIRVILSTRSKYTNASAHSSQGVGVW